MNRERYKELTNKIIPKEDKVKNGLTAFFIGGLIGFLGQLIVFVLEKAFNVPYKDATSIMIVILIFLASLFTALGFFDNWMTKAKAGLLLPTTGFAHSVSSSALDYKKEGLITGLGSNFFKLAGSVILYGILSAFILVIVRVIIGG